MKMPTLLKSYIDLHKASTFFVVLFLIVVFKRWDNVVAWVYLALHGSYGFLWFAKGRIFPDAAWEQKTSVSYGLLTFFALSLYWVAPLIIVINNVTLPPYMISFCILMYAIGVFFHFTSDMQKYTFMQLSPGKLLTTGFWAYSRNPNYFGELLIYLSFALLAKSTIPLIILAFFVITIWLPRMRQKDKSLSRHKEFKSYKRKTGLIFPRFHKIKLKITIQHL